MRSRSFLYSLFLLSFLLLSGNSPVYAEEPDPTPTFEPLFVQPTEIGIEDYYCPDGTPEGYLTETPSPEWMLHCSECIPQPTGTPWTTEVPLPTWMPTQTPTITPTPGYVPEEELFLGYPINYVCVEHYNNREGHTYRDLTSVVDWPTKHDLYPDADYVGLIASIQMIDWSIGAASCNSAYVRISRDGSSGVILSRDWGTGDPVPSGIISIITPVDWTYYFENGNPNFMDLQELFPSSFSFQATTAQHTKTDTTYSWGFSTRVYSRPTTGGCVATLKACGQMIPVYYGINPDSAPEEPTPVPENLCTSIEAEGEGLNIEDFLPMPLIGEAQCAGWEEWEGGSIFGVDFTIPQVQVCLRPIVFGNIQLFDMSISLDWFIYVMGFVAILRWFIRS